jgi:hypothetical protein
MTQFISRAYNTFEIDEKSKSLVIKKSKESRLLDEIYYYKNLPSDLSIYFPRVLYSKTENDIHELGMEYYAYNNLGNLMIYENFNFDIWKKTFNFLLNFINNCTEFSLNNDVQNSRMMYIEKTEKEYQNLINNFNYFKLFEENEFVFLNGRKLKTFSIIWPKIKEYIENTCLVNNLTYIHGDFCFSNILFGYNNINKDVILKFIDPRGSFGQIKSYGDSYYDLAKLMHSCDGGYEYFITDNFEIKDIECNFTLNYSNDNKFKIKNIFDKIINDSQFNATKIQILQGTIFIGMCARHYDSFERQKAMLLTGLQILNDVYEKI